MDCNINLREFMDPMMADSTIKIKLRDYELTRSKFWIMHNIKKTLLVRLPVKLVYFECDIKNMDVRTCIEIDTDALTDDQTTACINYIEAVKAVIDYYD